MGRKMEEWRGREALEGSTSLIEGDEEGRERGCMESSSHYVIGAPQGERPHLALTRSHTDEERYWGRGNSKSFLQEVTSGSRGCAGDRSPQNIVTGDCTMGDTRGGGSPTNVSGKDPVPGDANGDQQPCVGSGEGRGISDGADKLQEWMEMPAPEGGAPEGQVLQKRKKKSKSSKEKKRGQANGGCTELGQGGGHRGMEESSFQDLYRGQSLEEEEEAALQCVRGHGDLREDSQCELSSSSTETTDVGTSEVDLKDQRHEINGNKRTSMAFEGRGSREGLGVSKGYSEEVPESAKLHDDCSQSNGSYRDAFRSPGNGCSGSAEGLEMEQGNYHSGDPSRGLGRCKREWDGEMEEKNANPVNYRHLQFVAQDCSLPTCQMESMGHSSLEGCGSGEETGTWCWCLHLYLGDSDVTPHVEADTVEEGQSRDTGYSMSSTLRVGEHLEERKGDGVNLGDIPEPLTKKAGKMGETPELQEWVNWWQGWAGSCRAASGRRRGKSSQAWGCRGEARGEGQKQQDVWVLREWGRRDGGKRGDNGPKVSGSEVWVLREQEEGKQDSAWPLGKEDIWVPREPRRHRSAYFMADNTKWTPRSSKPGVSDKGEP